MLIGQIEYELLDTNLWCFGQARYFVLEIASENQPNWEPELEPRSVILHQDDSDSD